MRALDRKLKSNSEWNMSRKSNNRILIMASSSLLAEYSTDATQSRRCRQLFTKRALQDELPGSLSNVLDLPLSHFVCISCIYKVESLEAFRLLARQSYYKQLSKEQIPPLLGYGSTGSPAPKKRMKDTSGTGASPFTVSLRPSVPSLTQELESLGLFLHESEAFLFRTRQRISLCSIKIRTWTCHS